MMAYGIWLGLEYKRLLQAEDGIQDLTVTGVQFFFSSRRRHTRFDCDWSSDVCSSDLWTLAHRLIGYSPMLRLFFGIDYERRRMGGAVAVRWMIAVVFLGTFAKAPARDRKSVV